MTSIGQYDPQVILISNKSARIEMPVEITKADADWIPDYDFNTLIFQLINTPLALANAIRRTMDSEKNCIAFSFDRHSLDTNDVYTIYENILSRISQLPIDQSLESDDGGYPEFTIDVNNNTNTGNYMPDTKNTLSYISDIEALAIGKYGNIRTVSSRDIVQKNTQKTKLTKMPFPQNIRLMQLLPGKKFTIQTIKITRGRGYDDPAYAPARVTYRILESVSKGKGKDKGKGKSGGKESEANDYSIIGELINNINTDILKGGAEDVNIEGNQCSEMDDAVDTKQYIDMPNAFELSVSGAFLNPLDHAIGSCDDLIERTDSALISMRTTVDFVSDNFYRYTIPNESFTIGKLYSMYISLIDPSIEYVSDMQPHPSKRSIVIQMKHSSPDDMLQRAHDTIIKHLQSVKKQLLMTRK